MNKKQKTTILILSVLVVVLGLSVAIMPKRRITQQKAAFGSVNVRLDPATATKSVGEEFAITIKVEAGNFKVSGIDLGLGYNKDQLQIISFTPNSSVFPSNLTSDLGDTTGIARIIVLNGTTNLPTGNFNVGTLRVKGKVASGATPFALTINKNTSSIVGESATSDVALSINQTTNGSYTITSGGGPTATMGPTPTGPTSTPTPEPCTHNAWDNNRCRRCNVPRGDGWVWNLDCSDNGSWGNSDPSKNDPGASFTTACACLRHCNRTVPPACPTLIPTPTATGAPVTPTPASCTHNAWDNNRCRRCNVPRGDGWVWNSDCTDNGTWGNPTPTPNDPGASVATWCACSGRCRPSATPPPACSALSPSPTLPQAPTATPTPEACPTHNAWDKDKCRRCNVPRGTGWVWSPECSDNGAWGNSDPSKNDPGASFTTACACLRRCNRTVPPACPTLPPAPTATPTTGACLRGESGNLDCSAAGEIGVQDLNIMVACWGTNYLTQEACHGLPAASNCRHSPNIVVVPGITASKVDIWDLDKLIRSWGAPPTRP